VAALAGSLDAGLKVAGRTVAAARDNVADYLSYEAGLLPERSAVASFRSGVLDLQLQLDRLQARIDQLNAN
jgi:ubiquinone biosynthesis protein UbiJ